MKTESAAKQDGKLQVVPLSATVSYQFREGKGGRTGEGLVASERWYPGIRFNDRFFSGLHQKNRFVPGIIWCGRFIPGLLTQWGFFPGLSVNESFTPGVVVAGVFMPGIVRGNYFVPGIVSEQNFLPGCFTASQGFVPGRFRNGLFESGLMKEGIFKPTADEAISPKEAHALPREGYGLKTVERFDRVGGLPIRGVVLGAFPDAVAVLPYGMATNHGVIIGGLGCNDDLVVLDPLQKLGDFGFEVEDPNDPGKLLGTDGMVERAENSLNKMLPGNSLGGSAQSVMGDLADAMAGLSEGANKLIDGLNQGWEDYWSSVLGSNPGGMIAGGDSKGKGNDTARGIGKTVGWSAGGLAGMSGGLFAGLQLGAKIGGGFGAIVGGVVGAVLGAAGVITGGETGAELGGQVVGWFVEQAATIWHAIFGGGEEKDKSSEKEKEKPKDKGTSEPGEEEREGGTGIIFNNPVKPLGPYISRRKTVIEVDHGESEIGSVIKTGKAPIRIIVTDTGAMAIVNYEALRQAVVTNPDRRVAVGLNPLTGGSVYIPGRISWNQVYEQSKMPWWLEKVGHPVEPGEA